MEARRAFKLGLGAILALSPLALAQEKKQQPDAVEKSRAFVWRVQGEKNSVYLAGSIHLLKKTDHPLPAPYAAAYRDSEKLYFEIPPSEMHDQKALVGMMKAGMYPIGESLEGSLSEESYTKVKAFLKKSKLPLPLAAVQQMRPWMLALSIATMEYGKHGFDPAHGVDAHFEKLALRDKKETAGFETMAFQIGIFSNLTKEEQEDMLVQTIDEIGDFEQEIGKMMGAWKTGDTKNLDKFMNEGLADYPKLKAVILTKRNKAWMKEIDKILKSGEDTMIIVGAAHLAGKDSVIDLLKKAGHKLSQLDYTPKDGVATRKATATP